MFSYGGAEGPGNVLGLLVTKFSNKAYMAQVEVLDAKNQGSKYKSIVLNLKSKADGKIYYLTLSKKMFDYPEIKSGNKMILEGKPNIFGAYVESFKVL